MSKLNSKIRRLRSLNLPHCTSAAIGEITHKEDATPEDRARGESKIKELDEYLHQFTPMKDGKCICCGETQGVKPNDPLSMIHALMGMGGKFTYGLTHGEGHCSNCAWPARANHYIGDWCSFKLIFQYHPDSLLLPEDKPADEPKALLSLCRKIGGAK